MSLNIKAIYNFTYLPAPKKRKSIQLGSSQASETKLDSDDSSSKHLIETKKGKGKTK